MRFATDVGNLCLWLSSAAIVIWVVQYSILAAWWKHAIGITLVGFALVDLAIFVPGLLALADPADFSRFANMTWYHWLAVCILVASTAFIITRITAWERIRQRRHDEPELPAHLKERLAELETENQRLRERLAEAHGGP